MQAGAIVYEAGCTVMVGVFLHETAEMLSCLDMKEYVNDTVSDVVVGVLYCVHCPWTFG